MEKLEKIEQLQCYWNSYYLLRYWLPLLFVYTSNSYIAYIFFMREEFEQLKDSLKTDTSWDFVVSKELYELLQKEYGEIGELITLVEQKRRNGISEILSLDEILSEEIFECSIPSVGLENDVLEFKKNTYRSYEDRFDLDCPLSREEYLKLMKKVNPLLRDRQPICCGEEGILDVFEKKSEGKIIWYTILQDCYSQEFLKSFLSMNWFSETELSYYTLNPLQLEWLFRTNKLDRDSSYIAFMVLNWKPFVIQSVRRRWSKYDNSVTWNEFYQVRKNQKFLLFVPEGNNLGENNL